MSLKKVLKEKTEHKSVFSCSMCILVQNMLRLRQVDTVTASELRNMQEVLLSKETEVVQSESTTKGLTTGNKLTLTKPFTQENKHTMSHK